MPRPPGLSFQMSGDQKLSSPPQRLLCTVSQQILPSSFEGQYADVTADEKGSTGALGFLNNQHREEMSMKGKRLVGFSQVNYELKIQGLSMNFWLFMNQIHLDG